jgi:acetylornithine deacetylase/succinyl-diaminopimelate desuccinylase-like protein
MTINLTDAIQYAHNQHENTLNELKHLVKIPSVSTDPDHTADMHEAARWLENKLTSLGFTARIFETDKHPIVFAEYKFSPDATTILVYGHYDVQPPDPLDLWKTGPFMPEIRGEYLFGRGASDMKGQVIASINAVESLLKFDSLKVNVKFIIEGEEEIGSPSLKKFLEEHKELFTANIALNPDTGMIAPDVPTITLGLRGVAHFELNIYGPNRDLHSGMFGGAIHNPAQVMCDVLSGMHNPDGSVALPGFYDSVRTLSEDEKAELARLPMNEDTYIQQTGVPKLWGEPGFTAAERIGARPTLEINGMYSGYLGEGSKTIIPSFAHGKVSLRLVPNQDPAEVKQQIQEYLESKIPDTVTWDIKGPRGASASIVDRNLPATIALRDALETVWGKAPVYKLEGGSVPVVGSMENILGIKSVLTGFGLPGDNIHSPNEKLHLPTWKNGIDTLIHFFSNMTKI